MKRLMVCTFAILISSGLLIAHGDMTHILGTVSSIQGGHVIVAVKDGKSEMVMLGKTTKYLIGTKAATLKDLKVGTRVVIDAKMDEKMKMFSAEEVRIGVADLPATDSKTKSPAPANHADHK